MAVETAVIWGQNDLIGKILNSCIYTSILGYEIEVLFCYGFEIAPQMREEHFLKKA